VDKPLYLSYLLRLWTVKAASGTQWRASLENPMTGDRLGFSDLEALFTYLEWIIQDPSYDKSCPVERDNE
jgi:hypothetical protein